MPLSLSGEDSVNLSNELDVDREITHSPKNSDAGMVELVTNTGGADVDIKSDSGDGAGASDTEAINGSSDEAGATQIEIQMKPMLRNTSTASMGSRKNTTVAYTSTKSEIATSDSPDHGKLHMIEQHRGFVIQCVYRICPCACSVNLLESFRLTFPGYTRNVDQVSDIIVFALFYNDYLAPANILLILACLASTIRWYVSLRRIDVEDIAQASPWRTAYLLIYIIPIFGVPMYMIQDFFDACIRPFLCCYHKRSLMQTDDPEGVKNQLEFDAFVELFVESGPAAIVGLVIFFQYTIKDIEVGSPTFYQETLILIISCCISIYNVFKTTNIVLRKSRRNGFGVLQYVFSRIQYADLELAPMLPFLGGLQKGTAEHCCFAGHQFRASDVVMLENLVAPVLHTELAAAKKLKTIQLSPFSFNKLSADEVFRFGEIFYRRNTTHSLQEVILYVVKIESVQDFQKLWKDMDEDGSGLLELNEFGMTLSPSTQAFKEISPNEKVIYRQDLFNALLFNSTGYINAQSHVTDLIKYAVHEGPPKFLTFCLGLKMHLTHPEKECMMYDIGGEECDLLTMILESQRDDKEEILRTAVQYDHMLIERSVSHHAVMNDEKNLSIIMENSSLINQSGAEGAQNLLDRLFSKEIGSQIDAADVTMLALSFYGCSEKDKQELAEKLAQNVGANNYEHLVEIFRQHRLLTNQVQYSLATRAFFVGMPNMLKLLDDIGGGLENSIDFEELGKWDFFKYFLDRMTECVKLILSKMPEEGCDDINNEVEKRFWERLSKRGGPNIDDQCYISDLVEYFPNFHIESFRNYRQQSCLTYAIQQNQAWLVELLLGNGVSVNVKDGSGNTPLGLMCSVENNKRDEIMMKAILEAPNLDPNVNSRRGYPVLLGACFSADVELIKILASRGADFNMSDNNGDAFLHVLCMHQVEYPVVEDDVSESLHTEKDSDEEDNSGSPPPQMIVKLFEVGGDKIPEDVKSDEEAVSVSKDANAEKVVQKRNPITANELELTDGGKPSFRSENAAKEAEKEEQRIKAEFREKWLEMKELALGSKDIDLNKVSKRGATALSLAMLNAHLGLARELLVRECDPNIHDKKECNLYLQALGYKADDIFDTLIDKMAIDSVTETGSALHHCVGHHQRVYVQQLLDVKSDVNAKDVNGVTPLIIASHIGNETIVEMLLHQENIDLNAQEKKLKREQSKSTALIRATLREHVPVVKLLVEHKADTTIQDANGNTALHIAVRDSLDSIVDILLQAVPKEEVGKLVDSKNIGGQTPLAIAIDQGETDMISKLLSFDEASVNSVDGGGNTLLIVAADKNRVDLVKLLIDKKCDINAKNNRGATALMGAVSKENEEMIEILLQNGASTDNVDNSGISCLAWACQNQMEKIIPVLIDNGVNVDQQNERGETALHYAVTQQNTSITKTLLECKADPNHADKEGNTPLNISIDAKNDLVTELLLAHEDIDVNKQNSMLHTPMLICTWKKDVGMLKKLFEKSADPNLADEKGWTPLMYAAYDGSLAVVKYLVETCKADITLANKEGKTCVEIAIKANERGVITLFEELGDELEAGEKEKILAFRSQPKIQRQDQFVKARPVRTVQLEREAKKKKESRSAARQASFGGVRALFGEDSDEIISKPKERRRGARQASFGGVAALFGDSDDEIGMSRPIISKPKERKSKARDARQASFGGVAQLFGKSDDTGYTKPKRIQDSFSSDESDGPIIFTRPKPKARQGSFAGYAGMFGDYDDEVYKPKRFSGRQSSFGGVATLYGDSARRNVPRQASFGGVAALFGEDE